jgi:hypothetical protein
MSDLDDRRFPLWIQILVSLAASVVATAIFYFLTGGLVLVFFVIFPLLPLIFRRWSDRNR